MPIIIMTTGAHKNEEAIGNLIDYMYSSSHLVYGSPFMVFSYNQKSIINSFKLVQEHFDGLDKKRIQHIIIGFDNHEKVADGMAWDIAEAATMFLGNRFQCCYAVHHGSSEDPNYVHIHLAVNPVSWLDGNRYYENDQNLYDLKGVLNHHTSGMYQWLTKRKESSPWSIE